MSELLLVDELEEETEDVGSYNHGYVQANLIWLLKHFKQYDVIAELSLDVSNYDASHLSIRIGNEMKPDVCLYPKNGFRAPRDILRMTEMPLLAIEVVSPRQAVYDILQKVSVYFDLGVQSCWVVDPSYRVVQVYKRTDDHDSFIEGEVHDQNLGIKVSHSDIFN